MQEEDISDEDLPEAFADYFETKIVLLSRNAIINPGVFNGTNKQKSLPILK